MLVTLLFWYMVIGVCFGFLTCYAVLKKYGTWQAICKDFNSMETKFDKEDQWQMTPNVAMVLLPLAFMVMFAFAWMPFLIYLGSKRK